MRKSMPVSVLGGLLSLIGLIVPSSLLIQLVVGGHIDAQKDLIMGSIFFKVGLVLQGLFLMMLGRMSIWKSEIQKKESLVERNSMFASVILLGILIAALVMRLYKLDSGLWYDEILTYVYYMDKSLGEIITTYNDQNNHLLYTVLARLSFVVFGPSVWSLRIPAVLFGLGSIWALYRFSCQVATQREALLSAALLAVSYHHVWFSQNARGYTGLLFWTILSSSLLVQALRGNKTQLWLLYAVSVALGIYTHLTMVFVAIGQFVVYLTRLFRRSKEKSQEWWVGGAVGFGFAGILTVQLYAFVLPELLNLQGGDVTPWKGRVTVAAWTDPFWMLFELAKGMNISFGSSVLVIVAFLVFLAGLVDFARKQPAVVSLLIVPSVIGMTVITSIGSTLFPRFFFFTMGFGVLILIRGTMLSGEFIARLLHLDMRIAHSLGIVLSVGVIAVSTISVPSAYAPKQDYQGALQFVEGKKEPGDGVVTVGLTVMPYERFYKAGWEQVETLEDLNMVRSRTKRTWLLYTLPIHLQSAYPEIMTSIRHDFTLVKQFYGTLGGGTIWVCRADIPPS